MRATPADRPLVVDDDSVLPSNGSVSAYDFGAHVVMFWLLVGMAALVFAPCVLIPIWLETEDLVRTEADVAARTAQLKAHIAEQDRFLDALRSDPLVNERIARRDLRFRRPGEQVESVANRPIPQLPDLDAEFTSLPGYRPPPSPEPPPVVKLTRRWLPDLPWIELFAKPPNRTIFMVMAGGLLVAAFVLFGQTAPRSPQPSETPRQAA